MYSQTSVILSTGGSMYGKGGVHVGSMHGGGMCGRGRGACVAGEGSMCGRGRGHVWQGACMAEGMHGGGTCVAGVGRHVWQGACMAGGMAGEMATAADGTYPPGMHSCSFFLQKNVMSTSSRIRRSFTF